MVQVDDLIEEYKINSIKLHNETDFNKKSILIKKNENILKQVFKYQFEKEFFDNLFLCNEPYILADIAIDSFSYKYDLNKSLEIMSYLKNNSNNIVFSNDEEINNKSRNYYMNYDLTKIKKEIEFYNNFNNDYLYHMFYKYYDLLTDKYNNYIKHPHNTITNKTIDKKIDTLLLEIKTNSNIDYFLNKSDIKFKVIKNYSCILLNSYYIFKLTNNYYDFKNTINYILSLNNCDLTLKLKVLAIQYKNLI